jgi:heterotetrameric sarcosine oxidase gamma subunit
MLERRSGLSHLEAVEKSAFSLREDSAFSLVQIARPSPGAIVVLGKLPQRVGQAVERDGNTLMKVGSGQFWIVGARNDDMATVLQNSAIVTPLNSSRARIALEGAAAREILSRSVALDFHPKAFKSGDFALTGIHHTPVLIHCLSENAFHVYALRTFAASVWDWLEDAGKAHDAASS